MNADLLPCPFCGGRSIYIEIAECSPVYFACCEDCEAEGPGSTDKNKAIEAWNRRALPPEQT